MPLQWISAIGSIAGTGSARDRHGGTGSAALTRLQAPRLVWNGSALAVLSRVGCAEVLGRTSAVGESRWREPESQVAWAFSL